jgi:hypothetical protein
MYKEALRKIEADHFHEIIPDDWFTLSPKKGGKKGRGEMTRM